MTVIVTKYILPDHKLKKLVIPIDCVVDDCDDAINVTVSCSGSKKKDDAVPYKYTLHGVDTLICTYLLSAIPCNKLFRNIKFNSGDHEVPHGYTLHIPELPN